MFKRTKSKWDGYYYFANRELVYRLLKTEKKKEKRYLKM